MMLPFYHSSPIAPDDFFTTSEAALEELELSEIIDDMDAGSALAEEYGFLGEDDEEDE